jgi:diguanylate cyclase (GGDEF)-like protein
MEIAISENDMSFELIKCEDDEINSAVSMPPHKHNKVIQFSNLDNLIEERDHYRRQSEILSSVNKLHNRLAGAVDLRGMIEAFSIWLMPIVEHKLLAYDNPVHQKRYITCSTHGTQKQRVVRVAEKALKKGANQNISLNTAFYEEHFYINTWEVSINQCKSMLLLVRDHDRIPEYLEQYIVEGVAILEESLQRGLEYEYLYDQARRDALTGLANRRVLEERIDSLLESAKRHNRPISIASMDLDRFKDINDTLGHAEGDLVLKKVAGRLSDLVRGSDLFLRMGGDEFLIVLPETNAKAARVLADRLCNEVDALNIRTHENVKLGISIGISELQAEQSKEEWLFNADEALYQAKRNGRGCVCEI